MATDLTTDRLRELAATRSSVGKVLSVIINLDPRQFATPRARATEISSVLDEAARMIREHGHLTHEERVALNEDVERVRERLRTGNDTEGAKALAIFASKPAGLFQVLKLPRPIDHSVAIADGPCVEPLARIGAGELWWLVLVDRRHARLLSGTADGIVELWRQDDETPGRHDQGGLSQARYQRSIDEDALEHLKRVGAELLRRLQSTRIAGLLLGGPAETAAELEKKLHADVAKCVVGRFNVDVWNTGADDVLEAARPVLEALTARRDKELLERIEDGLAVGGRAAAGLADVLLALHERRVDTLVVQEGFSARGTRCPQCGWLGVSAAPQCPADGTITEPVANVVDAAVAEAFGQDAHVRYLPLTATELETKGSIAALLRF